MQLTKKQEEAVKLSVARYINKERYTVISGYAGTGKSETVKFIISALNLNEDQVAYISFTGKGANMLTQKGCPNAMTAHKLLYKAVMKPDGSFMFVKQIPLEKPYKCIVVDEVSMLPKEMWNLLLSHKIYVIAMGDPEQLPPINPEDNNHVLDNPHIFLDEIMRQAFDSEIIRLASFVREGNLLKDYKGNNEQCLVIPREELSDGMLLWADQVICAKNDTRRDMNVEIRKLRGFGEEPEPGDKIIALRNQWDWASSISKTPLTNGTILTINDYRTQNIWVPKYIHDKMSLQYMITNAETEDFDEYIGLPIDYQSINSGIKQLSGKQEYMMKKNKNLIDPPLEFNYGYSITCHKAQGSQWNKVLVIEENFPFTKEEHRRWLYTACTRPSEKLVIVKNS